MIQPHPQILSFIKIQSRNKIVIYKTNLSGIKSLDLGFTLSSEIQNLPVNKHFALQVRKKLNKILDTSISNTVYGNILAMHNLGILFEPDLKIDFINLIDNYSQNNVLFLKWNGEIENDKLFFLSKSKGIEINMNNLSHIILKDEI